MTISATRRFIDLIGQARLEQGSMKSEVGVRPYKGMDAVLDGKEFYILRQLYPNAAVDEPEYPLGSTLGYAYRTGRAVEAMDLLDVVRIMGRG